MSSSCSLSEREQRVLEIHEAAGGFETHLLRVPQWPGAFSVFDAHAGRLWVHNDNPRKQSYQELYFHSALSSPASTTLTCSHTLKFWDLKRIATPRETARLQGFPDHFVLPTTRYNRLFGNAVAVPCAAFACSRVVAPDEDDVAFLDLCAGIGGFHLGVLAACPRARCVGASEILPAALKCYHDNFPDVPLLGDADACAHWPTCDLIVAGFPCQPFSAANRTREQATHPALDFFSRAILPALDQSGATRIVLENVPLLRRRPEWTHLRASLEARGFALEHGVLDAYDFGLPQHRKRLYIVGRRRGGAPPRSLAKTEATGKHPRALRDILEHH